MTTDLTISFTEEELASYLKMAAESHHTYEAQLGHNDEQWANWYAHWIFVRKNADHARESMERNP